jgi:hypothetical protein
VFINDVLQLRVKRAGVTAARFVTNSTIGLFGLIDIADHLGLPHHSNEFGVTLGRYGVQSGPYMYVPLVGPSTVRDIIGSGVDLAIDPLHWVSYASRTEISEVRFVVGGADTAVTTQDQLDALLSDAADPYATLRSVYLQNKQGEIDGGEVPAALPSFDDPQPGPVVAPVTENKPALPMMTSARSGVVGGVAVAEAKEQGVDNEPEALQLSSWPVGLRRPWPVRLASGSGRLQRNLYASLTPASVMPSLEP